MLAIDLAGRQPDLLAAWGFRANAQSRLVIGHAALKPPRNERGWKQDRKVNQRHDGIHLERPIGVGVDQRRVIDEVRNGRCSLAVSPTD
jgi:hypothetical protein